MATFKKLLKQTFSFQVSAKKEKSPPLAVETVRLKIQPLSAEELKLYVRNDGELEKKLKVAYVLREISTELANALATHFLPLVEKHPKDLYFYTLWTIIAKDQNQLVGDICFKGPPNEEGQVEIGYGTYPHHQGKGYMAETVGGILHWCQLRPAIKTVLAETETGNIASERILEKNRFHRYHQGPDYSWWERLMSE